MKFENMAVWKRSARLSAELYKHFVDINDYGFRDQITRSSLSIPSNIAEDSERDSKKDFIRFIRDAKGSCGELSTQLSIGMDKGYIPPEMGKIWI